MNFYIYQVYNQNAAEIVFVVLLTERNYIQKLRNDNFSSRDSEQLFTYGLYLKI